LKQAGPSRRSGGRNGSKEFKHPFMSFFLIKKHFRDSLGLPLSDSADFDPREQKSLVYLQAVFHLRIVMPVVKAFRRITFSLMHGAI
jgi:hypothetical protein